MATFDERRCRALIDRQIYPLVEGLSVHSVTFGGGVIAMIDVPPQEEASKPFLVTGAMVGGRHEGAFISIVRRRGEDSIPITAAAIHSMLSAGRRLLHEDADRERNNEKRD
jgi:hypothetical protein